MIDLELTGDVTTLSRAIGQEIARCCSARTDGARTRYQHAPVRMTSAAVVQIEWKVVPGADAMLTLLAAQGVATGSGEEAIDYRRLASVSRQEQEKRLRELVETGNTIAAIDIARRLYGYDLTAAKTFVDGLAAR